MTTRTPKTDAAERTADACFGEPTGCVTADFARTLELELSAMTEQLEQLRASWGLKEIERHRQQERAERAEKDAARYRHWRKHTAILVPTVTEQVIDDGLDSALAQDK